MKEGKRPHHTFPPARTVVKFWLREANHYKELEVDAKPLSGGAAIPEISNAILLASASPRNPLKPLTTSSLFIES